MPELIDRVDTLGADRVSNLTRFNIMKSDPIWAQLAGEIAALQALVVAQRTSYNALLAKLDSNHAAAMDHVSTLAVTATAYPDPKL